MATSINSYSVKLSMDASGFVDATKVSRSEARQLIKDIEAARDPFENYALEQDRLRKALDAGAISQGTYNRLLKDKQSMLPTITSQLGPVTAAYAALGAAIVATGAATAVFISHMRDVQGQIDETADKAEQLGVSFTDLKTLQFGFAEGGGLDGAAVETAITKLQVSMANAVEGDEKTRAAFAKLGLDAGELVGVGPKEAMLQIADAMESVGTHAERLQISMDIFGKSGTQLASTLGKGREELEASVSFAEKWSSLTDSQIAMVGANNDAWDRIGVVIQGVTQQVAAELAPAFEIVADSIMGATGGLEGAGPFMSALVDGVVDFVGFMYDANELALEIGQKLYAASNLDFAAMTAPLSDAAKSFDTSGKLLAELETKRKAAREAAAEAETKREEARHALVMQDTDKEAKAKEESAKKVADEQKRLAEEAAREAERIDREQRKQAEQALSLAQKQFDEEQARQMKLREDVAKGPGSGMEAGSAEAARYMAQQANAAIAEATVGVDSKPTDEQLVETAKFQLEVMRAQEAKQNEMVSKLQGVTDAIKDNGWEAI